MEDESICLRCKELCQKIAHYLGSGDILFPWQTLGTIAEIRLRTHCSVCEFLLKTCGRSCPPSPELERKTTLEIQTNNHGTLYIQETSHGAHERFYLLPLQSSWASISGRLVNPQCDPDLLCQWLQSCQDRHGQDCYTPGWSELTRLLLRSKYV